MNQLSRLLDLAGSLELDAIDAPALRGNPLGDPSLRKLAVYTPPGYDPHGSTRYPVLYCLHGYTGTVPKLLGAGPWETNVVQWCDRLIAMSRMPPTILVVVDGFTRLGGSQYVDSAHNGAYATYVVRDVIGDIDARYRTIAAPGGRAVFGKSSGGFGAMHLVLAHPGVFGAFASHSGDAYFRTCYTLEFALAQRVNEAFKGDIEAFITAFETTPKPPPAWFAATNMFGMTAAYSPSTPARKFALDLPFDVGTGEWREDVLARWLAFDPAERVRSGEAALEPLRLRYLDCGRRDEYGLDIGARIVTARMRELGLSVRHEEFDDDHRNVGYRYEVSLPALTEVLDRAG